MKPAYKKFLEIITPIFHSLIYRDFKGCINISKIIINRF